MPHSMPYSEQKHKWFTMILFIGLPFLVIYKWIKDDLPQVHHPDHKKIN